MQQVCPGLDRLPVPVGERDELLPPVGADTDHDQQAQLVLLQPDVDVDAVDPQVDVVHDRQIPGGERALLGLPGLGQLRDHRRRQPGRAAEELAQRGHEVPGREAVQVEQRQHFGDLRCLTAPCWQDRRGEPGSFAGVGIDATVVDPGRGHLHRPGRGQDLARPVRAGAHHQPAPALVSLADEPGDIGVNLGPHGLGQHPAGTLTDDLIDQRRTTIPAWVISVGSSRNYGKHGSYLPDRRWRADLA
jgi:hypothetical protein